MRRIPKNLLIFCWIGLFSYDQGEIKDDMTVVVAMIHKYQPEWATFRLPNAPHIDVRRRSVRME